MARPAGPSHSAGVICRVPSGGADTRMTTTESTEPVFGVGRIMSPEAFLDNNTRMLADLQALQRERLNRHNLDQMTLVERDLGS